MPLFDMSVNVLESESAARKRTHEEFTDDAPELLTENPNMKLMGSEQTDFNLHSAASDMSPKSPTVAVSSPLSSPALTEAGSSTPSKHSPSPNRTPSKSPLPSNPPAHNTSANLMDSAQTTAGPSVAQTLSTQTQQSAQRKRPTAAEKEAAAREREEKRRKKEDEKATKAAEREAAERDRDAKRRKKEDEKAVKAAEKAAKDAEKAAKEVEKAAEKAAKEAEKAAEKAAKDAEKAAKAKEVADKKAAADEKRRKQEQQVGKSSSFLTNFLQGAPSTPSKKAAVSTLGPTESSNVTRDTSPFAVKKEPEPDVAAYERVFKPFFVKPDVKLATSPFEMTEETKAAKSNILDEHIRGERGQFSPSSSTLKETLDVNGRVVSRGIIRPCVRELMDSVLGNSLDGSLSQSASRTDSQTARLVSAQEQLESIPVKILRFHEDVRPAYIGTVSSRKFGGRLQKAARKPNRRILSLDYDYDSEAEWEEEDGEDLDDCEDEEEDKDDDEEMADFLDDTEEVPTVRPAFLGENQPVSSGLCFENRKRLGPTATMYKYRMEFLLESLEHHSGIDPFSTSYWEPSVPQTATKDFAKPAPTQTASSAPVPMGPPQAPGDAFALLTQAAPSKDSAAAAKGLIPKEVLEDFKAAVISDELSDNNKNLMIELLAKRFPTCTKAQIKTTLDKIATRAPVPGGKKAEKKWILLPAFAV